MEENFALFRPKRGSASQLGRRVDSVSKGSGVLAEEREQSQQPPVQSVLK